MSLSSIDITRLKRLSLKRVKLPAPEPPEATPPLDSPPTYEEILYAKMRASNPAIEDLVETLGLVSIITDQPLRKISLPVEESQPPLIDVDRLTALASKLLEPLNSYSREEVIERIVEATKVSPQRAEVGFTTMLKAGAIELTLGDRYYLSGSTPF